MIVVLFLLYFILSLASPKIVSQKTDKDSPYNIMFIFLIHAYPRPVITLINPANKFIVETSLNRGVLEVTESPIAYGHSVNVIVKFVAVLMNCFSGTYRIKACNKLGCTMAEFSVGNGNSQRLFEIPLYSKVFVCHRHA